MAASKKKMKKKPAVKAKAQTKVKAKTKAKTNIKAKAKIKTNKSISKKTQAKSKSAPTAKKAKTSTTKALSATAKPISMEKIFAALEKQLTPLADRILVLIAQPETSTPGGLIIPVTSSERPNRGKVLATGTGRRGKKGQVRPLDVTVGDWVLFGAYAGTPVNLAGSELVILREDEVLGIEQ